MKITQIRNATILIEFGGFRFLVDPVLADKDSYPGFPGTYNDHVKWPKVDLPLPISEIIDVDAVIITHTHEDHLDKAAMEAIRKDIQVFAQHEGEILPLLRDVQCRRLDGHPLPPVAVAYPGRRRAA